MGGQELKSLLTKCVIQEQQIGQCGNDCRDVFHQSAMSLCTSCGYILCNLVYYYLNRTGLWILITRC